MLKQLSNAALCAAFGLGCAGLGLVSMGASMAYATPVVVSVDGVTSEVDVLYGSVAEVLTDQGIALGPHDLVEPALPTVVTDDLTITVKHARPVSLDVDGRLGVYWTTATSVAELVGELGFDPQSVILSSDLEAFVDPAGLALAIDTGHDVTVSADGRSVALHSTGTVADALITAGLAWDEDDLVTPRPHEPLTEAVTISLIRVETGTTTREVAVLFETTIKDDPELERGRTAVDQPGETGLIVESVSQTYHDGVLMTEVVTASEQVKEPVARVERHGTKPLPPNVTVTPGSAQEIAFGQVMARGWDATQFQCLVNLWNRESGWRVNASNPSGAYGIPQALPGSKMASAGPDWQTNPATQITWGLGYISSRYGTPCGAWDFFQSRGWY